MTFDLYLIFYHKLWCFLPQKCLQLPRGWLSVCGRLIDLSGFLLHGVCGGLIPPLPLVLLRHEVLDLLFISRIGFCLVFLTVIESQPYFSTELFSNNIINKFLIRFLSKNPQKRINSLQFITVINSNFSSQKKHVLIPSFFALEF